MYWRDYGKLGTLMDACMELQLVENQPTHPAPSQRGSDFPLLNLWMKDDQAVITTEIPGVEADKVDISVSGKTISIKGSRQAGPENGEVVHRRERWSGEFSKAIELPFDIEADKVEAHFSRGVLSIAAGRAEADKPRRIEITSGETSKES